ncbi:hypothetical protein C0J52_20036 [Blattella germanica]|nr:hypothetical protein C0J52_20036 [Blattella germanica]
MLPTDVTVGSLAIIQKIPLESSFLCRNTIKGSDFDFNKFKFSSVSGQPCYEPLNVTIYTLEMIIGDNSRHGGYVPLTEFNYTCPNIHNSPNKTIKCGIGGQWLEKDDKPWPNCNSSGTNSKISLPVLLSFIIILVRYNS